MRIKSFLKFQESTQHTPAYVEFLRVVRQVEEWLNELGVEIVSSNCWYRPEDQPYCYIKFSNGDHIYVGLMYGDMTFRFYSKDRSLAVVDVSELDEFFKKIKPLLK